MCIVFSVLSALFCLLGCIQLTKSSAQQPKSTYAVIVDCGSSGTRAHLYEWASDLNYPELLNDIEPMRDRSGKPINKKIEPGLSSVQSDPDKSSDYMEPLIDFITDHIPESLHDSTAIYIMGTAGMRLLDQKTQLKIMNDIVQDLKSRFKFAKVVANVITGSQEGMYEWITVNSKLKRFLSEPKAVADKTRAIIEMGGSSVQVAYQMRKGLREFVEKTLGDRPQSLKVFQSQIVKPEFSKTAGGGNLELFSVSFLGLGGNSAREAYVDLLINLSLKPSKVTSRLPPGIVSKRKRLESVTVLKDPCLPKGASETMEKPVRMLSSEGQSIGFNIDPEEQTFKVNLLGTGDYGVCRRLLKELLVRAKREQLNCELGKPCTMSLLGTPFLPFGLFHILGLSEFYYVTSNMMNLAGRYDRDAVTRKAKQICRTPYSKLVKLYPNKNRSDPQRIRNECFKAAWMDTFLFDGLKMPARFHDFETVGKIKGDDIDWTLGAALDNSFAIENAVEESQEEEELFR